MQNCTRLFASKLSGAEQLQALWNIMLNSRHRTEQRALKKPAELARFFCLAQKDGQSRVRGRIKTQTTCFHAVPFLCSHYVSLSWCVFFCPSGQSIKGASCFMVPTTSPAHPCCAPFLCSLGAVFAVPLVVNLAIFGVILWRSGGRAVVVYIVTLN
ncbi:hypothetical protein [Vibrio navarrensis]|uniref:hypothetical protein n=1 Tax=Vibrio navarrensis TaxID=29495 RepID=UPI001558AF63|nr:hypothetical protein [Vibrio navarrensis]